MKFTSFATIATVLLVSNTSAIKIVNEEEQSENMDVTDTADGDQLLAEADAQADAYAQ